MRPFFNSSIRLINRGDIWNSAPGKGGDDACLESCAATVWTINLPDGEARPDGTWAYGERIIDASNTPQGIVTAYYGEDELGPRDLPPHRCGGLHWPSLPRKRLGEKSLSDLL